MIRDITLGNFVVKFDDSTGEIIKYVSGSGNLEIPSEINGVTIKTIGQDAFNNCSCLEDITIPNTVDLIKINAFTYCINLKSVHIIDNKANNMASSLTSIEDWAFAYCFSLTTINLPDSITSIEDGVFDCCYNLKCISIPTKVTLINNSLFSSCYNLKSVYIPYGVTSIKASAFYKCTKLEYISIPASVTLIK